MPSSVIANIASRLRQARRIVDLAYPRFGSALLQRQSRGGSVRDDVATDRFLRIGVVHGARSAVDLRHNLIRDDHGNTELICETLQRAHEFGEVGLPTAELAAAHEVCAVE